MKKLLLVYGLLAATSLAYLWYYGLRDNQSDTWRDTQGGLKGEIEDRYVMVTFQAGLDYWRNGLKGFEDAAQALNVSVEFRGAAQYSPNEEITVLEQVIAKKPAGIAVTAINPTALNAAIGKAVKAGIPVVVFDSDAPESMAYSFLGTDNYNAGVQSAREMGMRLNGKGKVAIVTQPNQLNHQQRMEGFRDTILKDYPEITIADIEDGKGDTLLSAQAAERILSAHPDVVGFFATQANGGVGVGQTLVDKGLAGKKVIISFDTDKGTLDMIKDGTISATMAQGTWNMGYWSLMTLFHLHQGLSQTHQNFEIPSMHPVPPFVDTGVTVVTRSNVEDYDAK